MNISKKDNLKSQLEPLGEMLQASESKHLDKDKLTIAIKELLSSDNKNKSLGEVSDELNQHIIMIKESVDQKEVTLDDLKYEIAKYLKKEDTILPGSLAQLLVGCVGTEDSCPMKEEHPEDVPFAYNHEKGVLVPLSPFKSPITDNTYAVLYITGDPQKIKIDSLQKLEDDYLQVKPQCYLVKIN